MITQDVTQCLVQICRRYVKMPTDQGESQDIMQGFYRIANFPNVIGAIDGYCCKFYKIINFKSFISLLFYFPCLYCTNLLSAHDHFDTLCNNFYGFILDKIIF